MSSFENLARDINRAASALPARVEAATADIADRVLAKVRSNASGRPGPERVTGDYVDAMASRVYRDGDEVVGEIFVDRAQALRLEFGFAGTDSLGRRYSQPPFPHWRPAAEWAQTFAGQKLDQAVGVAIG